MSKLSRRCRLRPCAIWIMWQTSLNQIPSLKTKNIQGTAGQVYLVTLDIDKQFYCVIRDKLYL